jgi:hypothetical protein
MGQLAPDGDRHLISVLESAPSGGEAEPFRQSRRLTLKRTVEKPMRGIVKMPMRHTLWAQVPRATTDARPG